MEVRASMDIRRFLNNTVLLLDLTQISLDAIIDEILHKLLDSTESKVSFDQARSALFTHDIGKTMFFSQLSMSQTLISQIISFQRIQFVHNPCFYWHTTPVISNYWYLKVNFLGPDNILWDISTVNSLYINIGYND